MSKFPEVHDLVAVTGKDTVEYYGYVDDVEYDLRAPRVCVAFFPGVSQWFDMAEIRLVKFPEPATP